MNRIPNLISLFIQQDFWLKPFFISHHKEWPKGQSYAYIADIKRFEEQAREMRRGLARRLE